MGMMPYKMVCDKPCHLPLKLEHRAFGGIKYLNLDLKGARQKCLLDMHALDALRNEAYESAHLFK